VNLETGQVFLRVWTDERVRIRGVDCVKVLGAGWARGSSGKPERGKHVERLKEGAEGYGVLCVPRDSEKTGHRNIASFDRDLLLKLGSIFKSDGDTYATILDDIPTEQIARPRSIADLLWEDLESILKTPVSATTKRALTDARIGQGRFRARVLTLWDGRCCVTGSLTLDAVRASHIKPWRKCDNRERLDPNNGLPLVGTLDALFDVGLITFGDDGKLLTARGLTRSECKMLGIVGLGLCRRPSRNTNKYLECHRKTVFQDGIRER
jgi:hypothetical protein